MTTETDTAALLAEMQRTLALQAAEIAALRAQTTDQAEDALRKGIEELEKSLGAEVPGARMKGPCVRLTREGTPCMAPWADHVPQDNRPAPIRTHSYLEAPIAHTEKAKPRNFYAKDEDAPAPVAEAALEQTYMTEKEAAAALSVALPELRGMVKAGTVKADKVGTVTLVRRQSVERVVQMAALAAHEEGTNG